MTSPARSEFPRSFPAVRAGGAYFLLMFAAGWALGPVRELVLIPAFGRVPGHAVEALAMLALMVPASRWVVRCWSLDRAPARAAAGLLALAMLLACEHALWPIVRGRPLREYPAHFLEPAGLISAGLFLAFAAMPLLAPKKNAPEGRGV